MTHAAVANSLVKLLLGPACLLCARVLDAPLSGAVCAECWRGVEPVQPPSCVKCADALLSRRAGPLCDRCRQNRSALDLARGAGRHEGPLREILHAFKYGGHRLLAEPLGARMREAGRDLLQSADAVVPVPLHPWRRLRRGFNQADDLARELGLPVWRALARSRLGRPQAALHAAERHQNVAAAFRVGWPGPWWWRRRLTNRRVILVDDVMTTGATLEACARVLRANGVRSASALTAARASGVPHVPRRPTLRPSTVPR